MFILHVIYYRISKRDECEMIMLIGLPGCGKTTWVSDIGQYPSLILSSKDSYWLKNVNWIKNWTNTCWCISIWYNSKFAFLLCFSLSFPSQVNKYVAEHPEKRYNVIGTAALVDKMKVCYDAKKYFLFYVIKYKIERL